MKTKYGFVIGVLFLAFFAFGSIVLAEDSGSSETPKASETPKPSETPKFSFFGFGRGSETPEASETPRVKGLDRLENHRLKFCEDHEDEINTRLGSLGDLVSRMLGTFDAIATRVENFYTSKVEPTHPISNYAALVTDIASKRVAAVTALTDAQNDVSGFICTGDNPKEEIRMFKTDMQTVKRALKDYRTSIKNLIVAVKTAMGETEEESPKPTETPEPAATPTGP